MKLNKLLVWGAVTLTVSCSNDAFFPSFNDSSDWETSLNEIIADNKDSFAENGIKITGIKFIDDVKVDRNLILGDEYGFFPVYSKQDSIFTVVTYNELMRNTTDAINL